MGLCPACCRWLPPSILQTKTRLSPVQRGGAAWRSSARALAPGANTARMIISWPFGDPGQKPRQTGVRLERFDRGIVAGQFGFRQCGMDFVVANLVQQDRRATFPAAQFRHQMMQTLAGVGRNGPPAQRADRICMHRGLCIRPVCVTTLGHKTRMVCHAALTRALWHGGNHGRGIGDRVRTRRVDGG